MGADERSALVGELALLGLLAALWGGSYGLIKVALESIPPLSLTAFRVTLAALALLAVCALSGVRLPRDGRSWRRLAGQSALNSLGPWTVLAWGQQYVDSALAGVLNSTSPIFVFFVTWLVTRHELATGRKLAGALLGLAGVVAIIGVDALDGVGRHAWAQLAVLLGAFLYALAAIASKRFAGQPPLATAAGTMLCAALVLVPASLAFEEPLAAAPTLRSTLAATALALLGTALALLIHFRLARTLGSLGVASQSYLRAGVSVLVGVTLLGETITLGVALGLAAAVVGVALINWPARESAASRRRRGSAPAA